MSNQPQRARILMAYREPEVAVIERSTSDVRSYYNHSTDEIRAAAGAGLIWFMTTDHLSPPICGKDEYGLDSAKWRDATSSRVLDLGRRTGISRGCRVLDLGNGSAAPAMMSWPRLDAICTA
ncbi:hypothetical protein DKT69_00990 [Micromonospora sicca]|uniref:Methyltransferase n=1 Tax=Micromonospora sicca TaxID=2202420 RepID=A0A317DRC9_9ACTN|nr:hypothetical protein [Micromonospora sp. 4G51]PWR17281.1 hypothetical protein DKT69_00990 [Micromonospora sp. 4G51]